MAKIQNISGDNFVVPSLGGRLVIDGQVVEVSDSEVYSFTCQEPNWAPYDDDAKTIHGAEVAARQPAPAGADAVLALDAKAAVRTVAESTDLDVLRELVAAENDKPKPRVTVVKAAEARLLELVPPADPNPGGDDVAGDQNPDGDDNGAGDQNPEG